MKLYNWQFAPNCRRVRMFVLEKGLDLPAISEVIEEGMKLQPAYLTSWPHALVPMLELDDGTRIGESIAICRYLEDEHPEPRLMGRSPLEKATIESWERRAYDECMIGTAEVVRNSMPEFHDRGIPGSLEPVPQIPALIERGKGRVRRYYKKFDAQLRDNPPVPMAERTAHHWAHAPNPAPDARQSGRGRWPARPRSVDARVTPFATRPRAAAPWRRQ